MSAGWAQEDQRPVLLAPALEEYDRAVATCPGAGIVAATIRDLDRIEAAGGVGVEPARQRLRDALPSPGPAGPDPRATVTAGPDPRATVPAATVPAAIVPGEGSP